MSESALGLALSSKSELGSVRLEASVQWRRGKDVEAVPVSSSPQRPVWVCPEDLAVGPGVLLGSWVWDHFPHSLLCIFGVPKVNTDFG